MTQPTNRCEANRRRLVLATITLGAMATGCPKDQPPEIKGLKEATPVEKVDNKLDKIERVEFNRLAAQLALPLFWIEDRDGDRTLDGDELAVLWGLDDSKRGDWQNASDFTPKLRQAYQRMVELKRLGPSAKGLPPTEAKRREVVRAELAQGKPTLVLNDFSKATAEDRAIVENLLAAAQLIEKLYARQKGAAELKTKIADGDTASRGLYFRNQGPWCVAPKTESEEHCGAVGSLPKKTFGLYPASLQEDGKFCEKLAKRPDGEKLLHQFVVVRQRDGKLVPIGYHEAYSAEMKQVAARLRAAAAAIKAPDEAAFKAYLLAAAQAFTDNNWLPADEAWSKMNAENSKWYLRIAPDEVYFEPCSRKAGFHVSFARINRDSLTWQKKLAPHQGELEQAIAKLAGPPYAARKVSFHLPDFVDIVVNAGDSRSPLGATIGQSLPNWGPVANERRGRTVAMTNLYTDADSLAQFRQQASSLLCATTMKAHYVDDTGPQVMSTVLHEVAHNLGPAHEYRVRGKKGTQIFGGPLASTMEELKAQTAALFFTDWLGKKKVIDAALVRQAHTRDIVWAFGHIARGMYTSDGRPKPYGQLAAMQLGFLRGQKAISWKPDEKAANGKDIGCFELHLDRFSDAATKLMQRVGRIKARGDKAGAEALRTQFVDSKEDEHAAARETIRQRWLRYPKASFVYAVRL